MGLREIESRLPPGFRFYPSDEELVCYYLQKKVANERVSPGTLVEVDLHAREPWELPEVAKLTAEEWYFFSFRDRKYATGSRTNRATKSGYWKATGKDRLVHDPVQRVMVGMRKTLVFYRGRAPNGQKTGWVMHEFRLETPHSPPKEDWVLCRVFHKGKGEAEQGPTSSTTGPSSPAAPPHPAASSAPPDDIPAMGDHHMSSSAAPLLPADPRLPHCGIAGDLSICFNGGSSALLNLAMLQYSFLDEFPRETPGPSHGHGHGHGSSSGMMGLEVGFDEHGMGEIEMECLATGGGAMRTLQQQGGHTRDGLYF